VVVKKAFAWLLQVCMKTSSYFVVKILLFSAFIIFMLLKRSKDIRLDNKKTHS